VCEEGFAFEIKVNVESGGAKGEIGQVTTGILVTFVYGTNQSWQRGDQKKTGRKEKETRKRREGVPTYPQGPHRRKVTSRENVWGNTCVGSGGPS